MKDIVVSVITPVFNEQESLPVFFERVTAIMESIGEPYEIIAVNDGSKDKSAEIRREHCKNDPRIKTV